MPRPKAGRAPLCSEKTVAHVKDYGFRLVIRSGNLNNGAQCGLAIVNGNNGVGNANANNGSSLNFIFYQNIHWMTGVPRLMAENKLGMQVLVGSRGRTARWSAKTGASDQMKQKG